MAARPIRIQPSAQSHIREAFEWYEQQREGLGLQLLDEIEALLSRIAEHPGMHPIHRDEIHKALARRFPYLLFYIVEPDAVVVIAFLHAHRDPKRRP